MNNASYPYSYYRSDIPAVKQFSNLPRDNLSLKTADLPGAHPKQIMLDRKQQADNYIENYLKNEKPQMENINKIQPKKIRNPFYADYNPSPTYNDSLDQFKNSYQSQGFLPQNKQPENQNFEINNDMGNNEPYLEQPPKQNDLSKNFANFYGVTPPPTGTMNNKMLEQRLQKNYSSPLDNSKVLSAQAQLNKNSAAFFGVTPTPSALASHRNSFMKNDPEFIKNLQNFWGYTEEEKKMIIKNLKLYKTPEEKYKGFYNPITRSKNMEYVPKYKVMVQVEDNEHFKKVNDELRNGYAKDPTKVNEQDIYKTANNMYGIFK